MANLDELQIKISASSKEADEAIKSLVSNLNNLNSAIEHLDTSKISSFSSAMSKLANIGANTNTTAKALKGMANELSSSFGIQTKKGIEDVTVALQALYKASRSVNLNDSPENQDVYWHTVKGLQKAIEENYKYKVAVDDTTKSVLDYVKATNSAGTKIGMADMVKEFGEDFKGMSSVLGKAFKNNLNSSKEGVQDLAEYLNEMNSALGTQFDTVNVEKGFSQLVETIRNAKDVVLDFDQATQQGLISGEETANAVFNITDRLFALIKEQDKYGASSGLGSLAEVFKQISNIQMPDMSGVADALKATQTASNNVGSSAPKVEEVSQAIDHVTESANSATQSANELSNALMVISKGVIAPTDGGSFSLGFVQSVEQALPAIREISNFQPPDLSTAIEQFNEYADAIYRALAGMRAIEDKRPGLTDKYYDPIDTTGEWVENNPPDLYTAVDSYAKMQQAAEGAREATERLGDSIKLITDKYYDPIDTTGSWVDPSQLGNGSEDVVKQGQTFADNAEKIKDAAESIEESKKKALGGHVSGDVLENVVALGEAFEKLGSKLDAAGDKGIKIFKGLITPLKMAAEEYKEKFENMAENVENFKKSFNAHMAKISQFWKRTMKTFTFMLVRKAITAIIKEIGNAVQSLAMYSNAMGTAFNTDISHMVADFQYLGRSIVSVFAPLLSYIAPIIDAIVDRIATLISYIGMLIAALGGSTSFTKAKKNVGNYAESLDQASKSAKNLTMGIDELNILSEKSGGGGAKPYDGWEDAWEDVEIPSWIVDMADKIKKMFADILAPLKKAWDAVKAYFQFAFDYMKSQLAQLAKSIWNAFIEVWNEDATVEMFKNILRIIADLMIVIGNLAKNFREAWDEVVDGASRGVQIFRGIRDILAILVEHVRNVTWYMVRWSSELSFKPLLDGVIELLHALYPLADFLGGVFEDVMKNVVLEYIRFLIEEGLPHLMHTISDVLDTFDFEKLRSQLQPLETSFVELLKRIDEATVNAFGNIGKSIAEFTKSDNFQAFLDNIQYLMDSISIEDVQKVLEGIGLGITHIGEALVNFVGSDTFKAFVDLLNSWLDGKTAEDIAGIIEKVAWAIGLFKFGAFASEGIAGFFKFASILVALTNLHTIATGLAEIAGTSAAAGGGFAAFAGAAAHVAAVVGIVIALVYSLVESFGGLGGLIERVKEAFDRVRETFRLVAEALNMDEHISKLKDHFQGLMDKLANMQDFWNILLYLVEALAHVFAVVLAPALDGIIAVFDVVIQVVGGVIDVIGGLASVIMGLVDGITTGNWDKFKEGFLRIGQGAADAFVAPFATTQSRITDAIKGTGKLFSNEIDTEIKSVDWEKIPSTNQVGTGITTGINREYFNAIQGASSSMQENTKGFITEGLKGIEQVDYRQPVAESTQHLMEEYYSSAQNSDWATYGTLVNTEAGNSIVNNSQPFTTANSETAVDGAKTFGTEYVNFFSTNTEIGAKLGEFGRTNGTELSKGFNESVSQNIDSTRSALVGWFMKIQSVISEQMEQIRLLFSRLLNNAISSVDVSPAVNTLFTNFISMLTTKMTELGDYLLGTLMPNFITTYLTPAFDLLVVWFDEVAMLSWWDEHLLPWFAAEKWDADIFTPLKENIEIHYLAFIEWWDESIEDWWNSHLVDPWFTNDKWDSDIFTPLKENIYEHFKKFIEWWDTSITDWWDKHLMPWIEKWLKTIKEVGNITNDVAEEVFSRVQESITEHINEAKDAVLSACEEMKSAIEDVLSAIGEVMNALSGFNGFSGDVTFSFGVPQMASGGFPAYGSLFIAGEPGAGTEWVGNVGGRTGVVSNNEITGIADAVYATGNAETELLGQLLSIGRAMLDKDPIVINDKDIAKMANRGQSQLGMSIIS